MGPNHLPTSLMADQEEFLHLVGVLMKNVLEGIADLRHWNFNPNEKSNKYNSSLPS